MAERAGNPTLLVGLGAFGREVTALAAPAPAPGGNLAILLPPGEPADPAPIVAGAREAVRGLLDLAHFVATTAPTDARGPRCDVFVIADLAEAGMATAAPAITAALGAGLRAEFRAILAGGDGSLAVCPLLFAPRAADRAAVAAAAKAIAARVVESGRPGARAFLVEDQSGKYLLPRAEIARSFAGFLHLVLYGRLRDAEPGARPLLDRDRAGPACFATFACATLAYDAEAVAGLCALALGREVIRRFREGGELTVAEIGAGAQALVPGRAAVEEELFREGSLGSLEQHLAPPTVDVPELLPEDSPEEIVERKLGPLWRAHAARAIASFREDVERFRMGRLASELERNGKACLARLERELGDRVDEEVARGPRGHARALALCEEARARVGAVLEALSAEIEAPDLAPFPPSPLDARLGEVEQAAFARPRRTRLKVFRALGTLLGAILLAGAIRGGLRFLAEPDPPYFNFFTPLPGGLPWALGQGPAPYLIGGALAASSVGYRLWKHERRHHNWAVEARDALDQALKRYLAADVVGYFRKRLEYGRLLWVQRIYRRLGERLDETIASLRGVRAALADADTRLAAEERRLAEQLGGEGGKQAILLRHLATPADARALYEELKPPEVMTLAARLLKESLGEAGGWRAAAFADPARLLAACRRELGEVAAVSPFGEESPALRKAATEAVQGLLRDLALKLSPPLELVEATAPAQAVDRVVFAPPGAEPLIRGILEGEDLRGGWEVRAVAGDPRRVHLLLSRGELEIGALALGAQGK